MFQNKCMQHNQKSTTSPAATSTTMETFASYLPQTQWNLASMLKTSGISSDVQRHLVSVYSTLACCVLSATLGCSAVLLSPMSSMENAGWLAMLSVAGSIGGSVWLHAEPVCNRQKRFAILMGIAASIGLNLASLVELTLHIDPSILITAFLLTTTVFLCFTGSALLAQRRSYLYLGGILSSALSTMALMNLSNLFFRSTVVYSANLYVGLAVFCGYVVFDTQMIIEKALHGDKDSLKHALELFLDFVSIFVRIVVILLKNQEKKDRKKDNNRR